MAIWIREDTATTIVLGPFVDPATPATEEESLTINQAAVRLSKNGAAFAQKNESTSATHMENGFYSCPLDTTDTSTPGYLVVAVDHADALIWWEKYQVVPQQVWDSLFGSDLLQVHAAEISAGLITATAIATDAIDADAIADNAINAAAIASDAITAAKIADGAIDAATFAAGAITATVIATGAIDADALATDAVTEIQSGMLTLAASLPGSPTADTVGAALKNAYVGIPQSAAGATGGLATFDDVSLGVIFGSVDDASAAAAGFIGNAGLSAVDDYYNGRFLIFTNNTLGARKITDYVGATKTFSFSGSAGEADQAFPDDPTNGDTFIIFGFHGE